MNIKLYILFLELPEHGEQIMADNNDKNMDNDTQIVFPNQCNKIREDISQVNKYFDLIR